MMKDTNNLRVLLHNADGSPVDAGDFRFTLSDNNTLFDYNNALLPSPEVVYWPWTDGNIHTRAGEDADEVGNPSFAFAEISTSRFVADSKARLKIEQISTGKTVLSIPLVEYLLLYKSERLASMGDQEFLDRKSEWELTMFLDTANGGWAEVTIWIEDWHVRINNIQQ